VCYLPVSSSPSRTHYVPSQRRTPLSQQQSIATSLSEQPDVLPVYHTFCNKITDERINKPVENQMSGHPSIMSKLTHATVKNSKCPSSGWCGFIPGYLLL